MGAAWGAGPGARRMYLQLAPLAGCQSVPRPVTELPAHQSQGRLADRGAHASHLAVAALADGQADPAVGNAGPGAYRGLARPQRWWLDSLCFRRPCQTIV